MECTERESADLCQTKRKRDTMLESLRHAASLGDSNIETLGEALALEKELMLGKPKLKAATRKHYEHLFSKLPMTWGRSSGLV